MYAVNTCSLPLLLAPTPQYSHGNIYLEPENSPEAQYIMSVVGRQNLSGFGEESFARCSISTRVARFTTTVDCF